MQSMDLQDAFAWGQLFAGPRDELETGMEVRADSMGFDQEISGETIIWRKDDVEECRWVFVNDPTDVSAIRGIYNDEGNVKSPSCFVVVKQNDPSDPRGDIIFDIFRLSPTSLLWHFNRVFTPPTIET